ncbi:MAG: hypothetical protein JWM28_3530 [Chitinophagaceae bacterium]|nr:hypothetical protein [Chitinophagaceae bacterium]
MTKAELKENLINSLISQGFAVNGHIAPSSLDKQHYKVIQEHSRKEQIELQKDFFLENFEIVKKYFINSRDINPKEIKLELHNPIKLTSSFRSKLTYILAGKDLSFQRSDN